MNDIIKEGSIILIDKDKYLYDPDKKFKTTKYKIFSGWNQQAIQRNINNGSWIYKGNLNESNKIIQIY